LFAYPFVVFFDVDFFVFLLDWHIVIPVFHCIVVLVFPFTLVGHVVVPVVVIVVVGF